MNKKDCEEIGYILSDCGVPREICDAFFELDGRIEPEYTGFLEVRGMFDAVDKRAEELVIMYNGHNWATSRNLVKPYAECLEEARREIYGEDYYPGMFR